jgi:hypothetical protein
MKKDFTEREAQEWIKSHGYKLMKKDLINQHYPTEWRYRQQPPELFKSYYTKVLGNKVHMIFGDKI